MRARSFIIYTFKVSQNYWQILHPISIIIIEKTFSLFVFGAILPKPTLVKLLNVKYSAVMYLETSVGPPSAVVPLKY